MDAYSTAKAAWHLDRIDGAPVHVQLVLSDLCNQDCGFCAYRMETGLSSELFSEGTNHNPNRRIPTAKALEIVEDCAEIGVRAIQFTGGGEPTAHPDHLEIIGAAQSLGLQTALVTNGVRLDPCAPEIQHLDWIRVSVDAGTEDSYCQIRRVAPSHWRRVWENIAALAAIYRGVLGVGFVVTPENYREIGLAARLACEHGAANLRVGAVFSREGTAFYGDLLPEIERAIADAKPPPEVREFEVIDLFGRRIGELGTSPADAWCGYQHLTTYIGGDLKLYRCCNTAYTRHGTIGDLSTMSFREAWKSARLDAFDARECTHCQFMEQNRLLAALTPKPVHVDFV